MAAPRSETPLPVQFGNSKPPFSAQFWEWLGRYQKADRAEQASRAFQKFPRLAKTLGSLTPLENAVAANRQLSPQSVPKLAASMDQLIVNLREKPESPLLSIEALNRFMLNLVKAAVQPEEMQQACNILLKLATAQPGEEKWQSWGPPLPSTEFMADRLIRIINTSPEQWSVLSDIETRIGQLQDHVFSYPVANWFLRPETTVRIKENRWKQGALLYKAMGAAHPGKEHPKDYLLHVLSGKVDLLTQYLALPLPEAEWEAKTNAILQKKSPPQTSLQGMAQITLEYLQKNPQAATPAENWRGLLGYLAQGIEDTQEYLALKLTPQGINPTDMLYLQAFNEDENALIKLMPYWLAGENGEDAKRFLHHFEYRQDGDYQKNRLKEHHPSEAELMLMLRIPEDPDDKKMRRHILYRGVAAFSSITRMMAKGVPKSTGEMIQLWSNVGFLSHSFRYWRYDAQGGPDSLFAKFGFEPDSRTLTEENKAFGKGYTLSAKRKAQSRINPNTHIEFRRGYLLASHPVHGTLVIRNSSPDFGRDTMTHPAYWSPKVKTDITTAGLKTNKDFIPLVSPALYQTGQATEDMSFLTQELLTVKDQYRRWKLDTRAFDDNDQFVGDRGPGFRALTNQVREWAMFHDFGWKSEPPVLAFVHPDFPPSKPYAVFPITLDHARQMADHLEGNWDREGTPNQTRAETDWLKFLQIGLNKRAELVMLDPSLAQGNNPA